MADFKTAYATYVLPWEGGYSAAIPGDSGGETYGGISRVYNPQFNDLWIAIDAIKRRLKNIPHNSKFPELQPMVEKYYKALWDKNRFGEINNQNIANLLFDYTVNSGAGKAVKAIQKIVNVVPDGAIGAMTLAKINASDPAKVYEALRKERRDFLTAIGQHPDKKKFLKGWLARVDSFPTMTVGITVIGLVVAAIAGYLVFKQLS